MNRTYRLSKKARANLEDIWNYTYDHWGPVQADKYYDEILDAIEAVASGQRKGIIFPDRKDYFKVRSGSHFVFYIMNNGNIFVSRVLHQSMNFPYRWKSARRP